MTAHTRLSSKGQIVIPKDVRDRLRWKPGTELEIVQTPGGVTIRPHIPTKTATIEEVRERLRKLMEPYGPFEPSYDEDWHESIDRMFREEYRDS